MQRKWWVRPSLQRDCGCARGGARKPACRRASSIMARSLLWCMSGPHTKPQGIIKTPASISQHVGAPAGKDLGSVQC